jgi:hypothetical protein
MTGSRKHIPMRTCIACRKAVEKRRLTRLVATETGVVIDATGKLEGRGAYVCEEVICRKRVAETDLLVKALRITLSAVDRQNLRELAP